LVPTCLTNTMLIQCTSVVFLHKQDRDRHFIAVFQLKNYTNQMDS